MEPLDIYDKIQPLVIADAKRSMMKELTEFKYKPAITQAHTHNGTDSVQFPTENLSDYQNYLSYQTTTLTPTQIKALKDTPIVLVQPPVRANLGGSALAVGAFKSVNIVIGITVRLVYSGTAYTGANALEFRYTNASGTKVTADIAAAWLNSSASAYQYVAGITTAFAPVTNAPIIVSVPTANPGAGNSPVIFTVHYRIVSFNQ